MMVFSMFSSEIHDLSRDAVDVAASAEPISGNDSPDSGHVSIVSVVTADKEASHVLPPNPFRLKPGEASSLDKTSHSKLQYIMVPIEPLAIKRKCEACQQPHKPDAAPRFWSEDTRLYIARQSQCNSNICKGKKRWMALEQKDFGWIRGSLEYLSVKPSTNGQLRPGIADHLLAGNDIPVGLQQPARTKCSHCGTEGRTEARPRWTKDIHPAFYAQARECRSETCKNKKRTFIPVKSSITYVTGKILWAK
jgi:hypothetical protein